MAGYSGTPLPKKLGLKPNARLGLCGAPEDFATTLGPLPPGVLTSDASRGSSRLDVIVCFASCRAELAARLPRLSARLDPRGGLWVGWPKKTSGVGSDLTEHDVRSLGLATGLVDNKVCAIDAVWSGLRFVVRLANRPAVSAATRAPARKKAPAKRRASAGRVAGR
jgi:hypothetical protein